MLQIYLVTLVETITIVTFFITIVTCVKREGES
jgi:hypothetical protein